MPTNVILVCVHDLQEHLTITHELLHSMFSAYGNVLRILIFERTNTFKSFVEYDNPQSALNARKNLNRVLLFEGQCRMSIYPSNLQVIKFQNNYPGGIDYTVQRQQQQPQQPFPYANNNGTESLQYVNSPALQVSSPFRYRDQTRGSSKSSSSGAHSPLNSRSFSEEDAVIDDEIMQMVNKHHSELCDEAEDKCCAGQEENENDEFSKAFDIFHINSGYENFRTPAFSSTVYPNASAGSYGYSQPNFPRKAYRTTTFPQSYNDLPLAFEPNCFGNMSVLSAYSGPGSVSRFRSMEELKPEPDFADERISQPMFVQNFNGKFEKNIQNCQEQSENNSQFANVPTTRSQTEDEEEKKSPVLHVLGIENKEASARMLFNIFSNFGNIIKLIFIKTRAVALVEFEEIACAAQAKLGLHNMVFMGKPLRITFSKYNTIELKPGQDEKYPDQLIIGDTKTKKAIGAAPSNTVLVSNLSSEWCKDRKTINSLFSAYGDVKSIKLATEENEKDSALVKMRTPEEALKAVACLNGTDVGGSKIQVCFSRTKL